MRIKQRPRAARPAAVAVGWALILAGGPLQGQPAAQAEGLMALDRLAAFATVGGGGGQTPAELLPERDPGPEARLRHAVALYRAGERRAALEAVDGLLAEREDFRAAHLLRAELLAAQSGFRLPPATERDEALSLLSEELRLRLQAPQPARDEIPAGLLRLAEDIPYLIAVDLQRARLYVIANRSDGPLVVRDFYASIGSEGHGKEVEGDNRTPIGLYRVTRWLDGERLPDLYGAGAFPVNYPNDWDRHRGRTGYGIWLHGVPSDAYARLPRSSEGCVTLANDDLRALQDYIDVGQTPVLLSERLEWRPRSEQAAAADAFLQRLEAWRSAWERIDTEAYLDFYDAAFHSGTLDREAFAAHKRRVNAGKSWIEVGLASVSVFDYPGEAGMRLVRFEQDYASSNYRSRSDKLQYWRQGADGEWRILREVEG